jgi:hypothetical protein
MSFSYALSTTQYHHINNVLQYNIIRLCVVLVLYSFSKLSTLQSSTGTNFRSEHSLPNQMHVQTSNSSFRYTMHLLYSSNALYPSIDFVGRALDAPECPVGSTQTPICSRGITDQQQQQHSSPKCCSNPDGQLLSIVSDRQGWCPICCSIPESTRILHIHVRFNVWFSAPAPGATTGHFLSSRR